MSAIVAIYNLNGKPVSTGDVHSAVTRLNHRGADGQGVWTEKNVGLGHVMRWTTPESLDEKLPLHNTESLMTITCDARLDNREDLIQQLYSSKERTNVLSDSQIILTAYERWGEECVAKFLGDFVFAIWDAKARKLFCARDSMGVKHFYYFYRPNQLFAIASEIKALFCIDGVSNELDETTIGDILILNFNDKEQTPYKEISRLPANNAMMVDRNGLRVWQYWYPSPRRMSFKSTRAYEEEFRDIFKSAVNSRLRSAYPVGSMLSGGLDSSSISCVASDSLKKNGKPPLETFSAIFPTIAKIDSRIDERRFIDSVVQHIRCVPNMVEADAFDPFEDMDKMHWHADHPIGAPNIFMDWAIFKAAQSRGVRVLLSGFDGDSTVSYGYEALFRFARHGRFIRLVKDAAALSKNMPQRQHTLKKLVWNRGLEPAIPEVFRQARRVLNGRPRKLPVTRKLPSTHYFNLKSVNPSFAEFHRLEDRYFELIDKNQPKDCDYANAWWNCMCNGLFAFSLETFEKTAAAFSVEPRFPFFDRRLIEFCMALPAGQKLYKGWTRSIFRRAMTGILPSDVQWRTDKANIGLSFKVNLLKYSRKELEQVIIEKPEVLDKYLDTGRLADAFRRYECDPLKSDKESMLMVSSVNLSNWLRSTA